MKNKIKMDGLYKTGFILLLVCVALFVAAVITAYAFNRIKLSVIFSAGGALLAFLGIILVMFSKPKNSKIDEISISCLDDRQ